MPLVRLDSFLTTDVINGRIETVEMAEEEALANGRVWGQCLSAELHMSDHRKCSIISSSNELSQMGTDKMICSWFGLLCITKHLSHLHDMTTRT